MCGPMRIVERYPAAVRAFKGKGAWALLAPVRFLMAGAYGLWLSADRRAREQSSSGHGDRVVSIGNLEAGGGGKTPCVIKLASLIEGRGGRPVVVSRGYRSRAERAGCPVVVPAGAVIDGKAGGGFVAEGDFVRGPDRGAGAAAALGDEVLLFKKRGLPCVVDPVRARGVEVARRLFSPTHILLDDAFQHRYVYRDFDILLLDAERPFDGGRLIPLGTLRERPESVGRAGAVVFTRSRGKRIPPEAERLVRGKPVFHARHRVVDLVGRSGSGLPLSHIEGKEVVLFSGIARPHSFEELAVSAGARPELSMRFADHHLYGSGDVEWMLRQSAGAGALFLTTEKDLVKVSDLFPPDAELLGLRIEMEIGGVEWLLELLSV